MPTVYLVAGQGASPQSSLGVVPRLDGPLRLYTPKDSQQCAFRYKRTTRQCIQCTTIISRHHEDNALADMVAGRSMLQYSIGYIMVHQTCHTRRLESSQHRLHRHRPSFVCSQRQQAMHSVYNHNFSPPGRQCAGRHGCWAQHAPILNRLPHGTPNMPHKASQVQPASAAPSSAVIRMISTTASSPFIQNGKANGTKRKNSSRSR